MLINIPPDMCQFKKKKKKKKKIDVNFKRKLHKFTLLYSKINKVELRKKI